MRRVISLLVGLCLGFLLLAPWSPLGAASLPQILGFGRTVGGSNIPLLVDSQGRIVITGVSGGAPGGADTSIQFNDGGIFGGFGTWDGSLLTVPGNISVRNDDYIGWTSSRVSYDSNAVGTVTGLASSPFSYTQDFESVTFPPTDWVDASDGANGVIARDTSVHHGGTASAKLSDTDATGYAGIAYTFTVPTNASNVVLSAWLKVSSDNGPARLYIYMTGGPLRLNGYYSSAGLPVANFEDAGISGTVDWSQTTLHLSSGTWTVTFYYEKQSASAVGSDAGWVDDVSITYTVPSNVSLTTAAGTIWQAIDSARMTILGSAPENGNTFAGTVQLGVDLSQPTLLVGDPTYMGENVIIGAQNQLFALGDISANGVYDVQMLGRTNIVRVKRYTSGVHLVGDSNEVILQAGGSDIISIDGSTNSVDDAGATGFIDNVMVGGHGNSLSGTGISTSGHTVFGYRNTVTSGGEFAAFGQNLSITGNAQTVFGDGTNPIFLVNEGSNIFDGGTGYFQPPTGYKSSDGTAGATVTTCTAFKNGLCVSGT